MNKPVFKTTAKKDPQPNFTVEFEAGEIEIDDAVLLDPP